jgi:NAD(P)-dependent dehydrogenase (short-subunit alcohol dehydrogenase family)
MPNNLTGKVAVVTGAASGIGLGIAEAYVAEGASVIIADIDVSKGEAAAQRLGSSTRFLRTDVRREDDIEATVQLAVDAFGRLDVMVNNAGNAGDQSAILDSTSAGFLDTIQLLAGAAVSGHRFAARQFIKQGTGGSVITTSSIGALQGGFSPVGYVAAKAAILGIVRQATFELAGQGIRSNAIVPGAIATPIIGGTLGLTPERLEEFTEFVAERLADEQPAGRVGRPSDIGGAAVFLASDLSQWVTGTSLVVDGGVTSVTMGRIIPTVAKAAEDFLAAQAAG